MQKKKVLCSCQVARSKDWRPRDVRRRTRAGVARTAYRSSLSASRRSRALVEEDLVGEDLVEGLLLLRLSAKLIL